MRMRCLICCSLRRTARTSHRFISCCPMFIKRRARPPTRNRKCAPMAGCSVKRVRLLRDRRMMPSTSRVHLIKAVFRTPVSPLVLLVFIFGLPMHASSQEQISSQQSGVSTGGAHAPVHDAEHRPITAGGFVDQGPVVFKDISQAAGLTAWRYSGG